MLELITRCYARFRLITYQGMFRLLRERDSSLSAAEAFAVDVIHLLEEPTIKEFADCLGISQPNATYKVNNLVGKGYVIKTVSEDDKRECHLTVSDRFYKYYGASNSFIENAVNTLAERYSPEELEQFGAMLRALTEAVK